MRTPGDDVGESAAGCVTGGRSGQFCAIPPGRLNRGRQGGDMSMVRNVQRIMFPKEVEK